MNKYRLGKQETVDVLHVDNTKVREQQVAKLKELKRSRNSKQAELALARLTEVARTGEGNILEAAIHASRVRCSVGEISSALEEVYT